MTTEKQTLANRRNARKSTGPRAEQGKYRSRQNAIRHGLTAETVILGLEHPSDYTKFEQAIIADYRPITAIEYQLVMRLASLLWRLRRVAAIESGLFQIQAEIIGKRRPYKGNDAVDRPLKIFQDLLDASQQQPVTKIGLENRALPSRIPSEPSAQSLDLAYSFLRLVNLNNTILGRMSRYEASLWRQVAQTLVLLESFRKGLARTIQEGGY